MDWMELGGKRRLRAAGLMSGTSADGVDVAIVDVGAGAARVRAFATFPYTPPLRRAIFRLFDPRTGRVDGVCRMNAVLGEVFADALLALCRRARIPLASIDVIGSHGQTVWHDPAGRMVPAGLAGAAASPRRRVRSTLQIGEPCVIAQHTGITTVADFRPRDVAAGGQGAPLTPYADYLLLAHRRRSRAVQNIGGVANVTFLPAGGSVGDILAFDTGPGNMIIDRLVHRAMGGRWSFDRNGKLAGKGHVCQPVLNQLLAHPYLRRRPPKTTGREMFGAAFADALRRRGRRRGLSEADVVATATAFTAHSIAEAYRRFLPAPPDEVILCGGGARNTTLRRMLAAQLSPSRVTAIDEYGIDAGAKEAVSFALLAVATLRGQAGNVPSATGAAEPVVLGKIIPGRPRALGPSRRRGAS
jgi:anhydro-N-acetylmuramic acid kinase